MSPPLDLSPNEPIWVRHCKTDHPATFVCWEEGETLARVRWDSRKSEELIPRSNIQTMTLPPRRRKKQRMESPDPVGSVGGVDVAAAVARVTKEAPYSPSVSASASVHDVVTPVATRSEVFHADTDNEEEEKEEGPPVKYDWNSTVAIKLEQLEVTLNIKNEFCKNKTRHETARYKALVKALTDPSTNQGRKVFRRGCHAKTITQVLGGSGTDPAPTIINPPPSNFIQLGEFYIAGRADWNPFTPAFPGDIGFVTSHFIPADGQEEFHLFTSCSTIKMGSHYYGKDVKGKYLYLGKYRRVPQDPDADVQEVCRTFMFSTLGEKSKVTFANLYVRKEEFVSWVDDNGEVQTKGHDDMTTEDFQRASEIEEKWDKMDDTRKKEAAWIVMVVKAGYRIEVVPIESCSYDEDLYCALVDSGASNGEIRLDDIAPV
mmetsp:Transcript_3610/g.6062  ORF Transcript_3610/g.6062 Transcript_3610/m.6062 type:complete len:431 (-) Transcript_3610:136-1428(-)|eukprot:CAMPEP_0119016804 /NCGR_PEP_ID=MMETSP1176-20130426/14468_1 /TAXON_ID=265551 /ORGANISM="Synedropsis recta cf, Strain CCMP1620" /LENGTH=430 /DNA_ID=CAMNT_0006970337 /DNA_START=120 /DNA_END=1412 /DNA_ORIENTATION=-